MNPSESEIKIWLSRNNRDARRNGKNTSARIIRHLDATPDEVWDAITNRDKLRLWFGEVKGDLSFGSTVKFDFGLPHEVSAQIKRCIPTQRLIISWRYEGFPEDYTDEIEIWVDSAKDTTLLLISHRSEHGTDPAGVGPGWESWLFRLTELLGGEDRPQAPEALEAESVRIWGEMGAG